MNSSMLSFSDELESFVHLSTSTADRGTLPTYPDCTWPTEHVQLQPYNNTQLMQAAYSDVGRMKRESRALVFISPETNAPIDHYRSDQSSSSAHSTSSEEQTIKLPSKGMGMPAESGGLPMGSKLHRWMEAPKGTVEWMDVCNAPMGLYYHGTSSIWNGSSQSGSDVNAGELTMTGMLNEDIKKDESVTQGVPKTSRLWTWIGDGDVNIEKVDI